MARRNPFRTEAEAFRLLLVTIAAFAAIAVASLVGGWKLGVPVWIVVTVAAIWYYLRPLPEETTAQAPARVSDADEWRLLVVANETVAGRELRDAVERGGHRASCPGARRLPGAELQAPPLGVGRGRRARCRPGAARREPRAARGVGHRCARARSATRIRCRRSRTRYGRSAPTRSSSRRTPKARSNWLERGVVESARQRFAVPIAHVVVDLGR